MEQELQKEPKRSFYALEQLRQTAEAILRGSQRLLKCRDVYKRQLLRPTVQNPQAEKFSACGYC